ncbi:MAG TPA: FHA domain-containing protein, partial [Pyrinomonadaceae bacterium]
MALLHITDASGRQWEHSLSPHSVCTIGRAPDNEIILNDGRVSRYHAHIKFIDGAYVIVDGHVTGSLIQRSANKVLIDGKPFHEHALESGERVTIGASELRFEQSPADAPQAAPRLPGYDDLRLGRTQFTVKAKEIFQTRTSPGGGPASQQEELELLRRKADILTLLYEMSQTLGSVFDLDLIFEKATDIIFRVTPADRVVALLRDDSLDAGGVEGGLRPVAMRVRDEKLALTAKTRTIGRTITHKVMRERVALLSQDVIADEQFASVNSIIAQGVRSTMCAPLLSESGV